MKRLESLYKGLLSSIWNGINLNRLVRCLRTDDLECYLFDLLARSIKLTVGEIGTNKESRRNIFENFARDTYEQFAREQGKNNSRSRYSERVNVDNDDLTKEYETLGFKNIQKPPDEAQIKRNYKRMALKFHPDMNTGIDTSALFNSISNAYEKVCIVPSSLKVSRKIYLVTIFSFFFSYFSLLLCSSYSSLFSSSLLTFTFALEFSEAIVENFLTLSRDFTRVPSK
jgi:hypothetical protein